MAVPPFKRRRTATSVLAGDHDIRPARSVLTAHLNGVPPLILTKAEEKAYGLRSERPTNKELKRKEKKAKKSKALDGTAPLSIGNAIEPDPGAPMVNQSTTSFWRARGPTLEVARSISPSPPPFTSPTPGPSNTSRSSSPTSSKRPHTPYDDEDEIYVKRLTSPTYSQAPKPRRKRQAAKKGWKGWVEGELEPSEKLINLDNPTELLPRRLRSGKNFAAFGEGNPQNERSWLP